MRGLHGDLHTLPVRDLVQLLSGRKASGVLALEWGTLRKQITLAEGFLVNASSNEPRELLGQLLINLGHITEEQFSKAFETQRETKIFLGKILVMTGSCKEEAVHTALSLKFRETLLETFRWPEGVFSFEPGSARADLDGLNLRIDLQELLREAEFRETAWAAIRGAFPTGGAKLRVTERNFPSPPKPGSLDARLVELIRDGHTIDELVLALHATDFFLYQRLYALHRLEVIAVDPAAPVDAPPSGQASRRSEGGAGRIRAWLAAGKLQEAEALARQEHAAAPTAESEALLRESEAELLRSLREQLLDRDRVPRLTIDTQQVKTMKLSPPERYLLLRMDGTRHLAAIVQASPLRELEALKYIRHFIDRGLVQLS